LIVSLCTAEDVPLVYVHLLAYYYYLKMLMMAVINNENKNIAYTHIAFESMLLNDADDGYYEQ
jgi:hypothetical protein